MKKYTGPIIDAHVHLVEKLGHGFGPHGEQVYIGEGKVRWADGMIQQIFDGEKDCLTPEDVVKIFDENGIESCVLMQGGLLGLNNEYNWNAQKAYPGRFYTMGSFDPYYGYADKIMHRLVEELDVLGFKFEVSCMFGFGGMHENFSIDSEQMMHVYDYAVETGRPVSFDMCSFGEKCLQVEETAKIAAKYPDLKIIQEHLFMPTREDLIPEMVKALEILKPYDNVYFSTACIPLNAHEHGNYPYPMSAKAVAAAAETVGHKKLLWGTDIPQGVVGSTYAQLRDYIEDNDIFTTDELADVMYGNAKRFYGI